MCIFAITCLVGQSDCQTWLNSKIVSNHRYSVPKQGTPPVRDIQHVVDSCYSLDPLPSHNTSIHRKSFIPLLPLRQFSLRTYFRHFRAFSIFSTTHWKRVTLSSASSSFFKKQDLTVSVATPVSSICKCPFFSFLLYFKTLTNYH